MAKKKNQMKEGYVVMVHVDLGISDIREFLIVDQSGLDVLISKSEDIDQDEDDIQEDGYHLTTSLTVKDVVKACYPHVFNEVPFICKNTIFIHAQENKKEVISCNVDTQFLNK